MTWKCGLSVPVVSISALALLALLALLAAAGGALAAASSSSGSGSGGRVVSDPLAREDPFYKEEFNPHEEVFNDGVREITILLLIGMGLLTVSQLVVSRFARPHRDEDFLPSSWEDDVVYSACFAICVAALAVALGAVLLLPISTISNEVLHANPGSWYIKWLNASLISGIWNIIFFLSNTALFVALPFAYLFCEAEGLPFWGSKRGLWARVKETLVTLMLLCVIVLGFMYVLSALIDRDKDSLNKILSIFNFLPLLYSIVSFFGVLMLLICTPLGFARLFTIVGDLVIGPTFLRNLDEEFFEAKFDEDSLRQKVNDYQQAAHQRMAPVRNATGERLQNGDILLHYERQLSEATTLRTALDRARRTPVWRRVLGYPIVMLSLTALTSLSLFCVILNVGQIVVGFRSLPIYQQTVDLGITSLSSLGVFGVIGEIVLIGYLLIASMVGLYTIPIVGKIRPAPAGTPITHIILNMYIYVILSSAMPLLSKILGITNFDLLGSFGSVRWLGNYYLVLTCNAVFGTAAALCLVNKFTARVRREILRRFALFLPIGTVKKFLVNAKAKSLRVHMYWSRFFKRNVDKKKLDVVTSPVSSTSPLGLKVD